MVAEYTDWSQAPPEDPEEERARLEQERRDAAGQGPAPTLADLLAGEGDRPPSEFDPSRFGPLRGPSDAPAPQDYFDAPPSFGDTNPALDGPRAGVVPEGSPDWRALPAMPAELGATGPSPWDDRPPSEFELPSSFGYVPSNGSIEDPYTPAPSPAPAPTAAPVPDETWAQAAPDSGPSMWDSLGSFASQLYGTFGAGAEAARRAQDPFEVAARAYSPPEPEMQTLPLTGAPAPPMVSGALAALGAQGKLSLSGALDAIEHGSGNTFADIARFGGQAAAENFTAVTRAHPEMPLPDRVGAALDLAKAPWDAYWDEATAGDPSGGRVTGAARFAAETLTDPTTWEGGLAGGALGVVGGKIPALGTAAGAVGGEVAADVAPPERLEGETDQDYQRRVSAHRAEMINTGAGLGGLGAGLGEGAVHLVHALPGAAKAVGGALGDLARGLAPGLGGRPFPEASPALGFARGAGRGAEVLPGETGALPSELGAVRPGEATPATGVSVVDQALSPDTRVPEGSPAPEDQWPASWGQSPAIDYGRAPAADWAGQDLPQQLARWEPIPSGRVAERVDTIPFVAPGEVAALLTPEGMATPEYLKDVQTFMLEQRAKFNEGRMTARDVAKAYAATLSSIGSGEVEVSTAERLLGREIPDEFKSLDRTSGKQMVRPEEIASLWMFSPDGQRALNAAESGTVDAQAWDSLIGVRSQLGRSGLETIREVGQQVDPETGRKIKGTGRMEPVSNLYSPLKQPRDPSKRVFNLSNIGELTDAINATHGDPEALNQVLTRTYGIKEGKTGFIGSMLGFGETPTFDAVEANLWLTGHGDISQLTTEAADRARWIKGVSVPDPNRPGRAKTVGGYLSSPEITAALRDRMLQGFNELKAQGLGADIDPTLFAHIMHHWVWDTAKGAVSTHAGTMDAMRNALVAGAPTGLPGAAEATRSPLAALGAVGRPEAIGGGLGAAAGFLGGDDDTSLGDRFLQAGVGAAVGAGGVAARRVAREAGILGRPAESLGVALRRGTAPGRTTPLSPAAERVTRAYDRVTPGRVEKIHEATRTALAEDFPPEKAPWATPEYWDRVFAAGEDLVGRSKMLVSQLSPETLWHFLKTGQLTSKFDALDHAGVLDAIKRSVPVSGKRGGEAYTLEDAARFAGDRTRGEAGADVAVLGGTNFEPYRDQHSVSRMYAGVTDGQALPNERRPVGTVVLVLDPATTARVTSDHHHYGFVNPNEAIHAGAPRRLREAMWGPRDGPDIPIGEGASIIDTRWAVGPEGENAVRFSNLMRTLSPEARALIAEHGAQMPPEDIAALAMRSGGRQDQPLKEAVRTARKTVGESPLSEEEMAQHAITGALNANRTEALILEPNLGDVTAIYLPGIEKTIREDVRKKGSAKLAGPKRTAEAQAQLVQAKIRELTGREVPIVTHILEPGGSKLPPAELSPGRAEVVDRYTKYGQPDIGITAPTAASVAQRAQGLGAPVPQGALGYLPEGVGAVAGAGVDLAQQEPRREGESVVDYGMRLGRAAGRGALRGGAVGAMWRNRAELTPVLEAARGGRGARKAATEAGQLELPGLPEAAGAGAPQAAGAAGAEPPRGFGRPVSEREANFLRDSVLVDSSDPRPEDRLNQPGLPNTKAVFQSHLGEIVPPGAVLYHETGVPGARQIVNRVEAGPRGHTPIFTTENPDLALGQAGRGVLLEFDPARANGAEVRNPAKALAREAGQGGEFTVSKTLRGAVSAITVATQRQLDALARDPVIAQRFDLGNPVPTERGLRVARKPFAPAEEAALADVPLGPGAPVPPEPGTLPPEPGVSPVPAGSPVPGESPNPARADALSAGLTPDARAPQAPAPTGSPGSAWDALGPSQADVTPPQPAGAQVPRADLETRAAAAAAATGTPDGFQRFWDRARNVIADRGGAEGKTLAQGLIDWRDKSQILASQFGQEMPTVSTLDAGQKAALTSYVEGAPPPTDPKVAQALAEWQAVRGQVEVYAQAHGLDGVTLQQPGDGRELSRTVARIAAEDVFGPNGTAPRQRLINTINARDPNAGATVGQLLDISLAPAQPGGVAQALRRAQSFLSMDLGLFSNATQSLNTAVVTGAVRTMRTAWRMRTREGRAAAMATATRMGVISADAIDAMQDAYGSGNPGATSRVGRWVSQFTAPGFGPVETFNRTLAALAGRDFAIDVAARAAKGDQRALGQLEALGLKADEVLAQGGQLTDYQQTIAARRVVDRTQFQVDAQDLPGWASSPQGRLVTQFKPFGYSQVPFVINEIAKPLKQGDARPLVTWLAMGLPMGLTAMELKRFVSGGFLAGDPLVGPREDESLPDYLWQGFSKAGAGGLVTSAIEQGVKAGQQVAKGQNYKAATTVAGELLGPSVSTPLKYLGLAQQADQGNPIELKRTLLREVPPVVGPALQNQFMPYSSLAKEINPQTKATLDRYGVPLTRPPGAATLPSLQEEPFSVGQKQLFDRTAAALLDARVAALEAHPRFQALPPDQQVAAMTNAVQWAKRRFGDEAAPDWKTPQMIAALDTAPRQDIEQLAAAYDAAPASRRQAILERNNYELMSYRTWMDRTAGKGARLSQPDKIAAYVGARP